MEDIGDTVERSGKTPFAGEDDVGTKPRNPCLNHPCLHVMISKGTILLRTYRMNHRHGMSAFSVVETL